MQKHQKNIENLDKFTKSSQLFYKLETIYDLNVSYISDEFKKYAREKNKTQRLTS